MSASCLSQRAWCPTGSTGASAAYTVSLRASSTDTGHLTPFEAGFSLSSGSDPAKDVILRIEAESNEETRVRLTSTSVWRWQPSSLQCLLGSCLPDHQCLLDAEGDGEGCLMPCCPGNNAAALPGHLCGDRGLHNGVRAEVHEGAHQHTVRS